MWERSRLWCHSDALTLPVQDNNTLENSSVEFLIDDASFCQNKLWTTSNKSTTSGVLRVSGDLTWGLYSYCSQSSKNTDGNIIQNITLPYGTDNNMHFFHIASNRAKVFRISLFKKQMVPGSHMFRLAAFFLLSYIIIKTTKSDIC